MMHKVLILLSSNRYQSANLQKARVSLEAVLVEPQYSRELWTEPIGTTRSDHYLNQLVEAKTALGFDELSSALKDIEVAFGRTPSKRQMGIVPIDLDLLQYDEQQLHLKDWSRPYVTQLIGQLDRSAVRKSVQASKEECG